MNLAYCYTKYEDHKFIGAILIISENGFPVEFKYSEPVVPKKLQSILYGSKLESYIFYDVIIPELIKSLEHKPDLFVVHSLKSFNCDVSAPVVSLFQTSLEPLETLFNTKRINDSEFLMQMMRIGSPVRVAFKSSDAETIKGFFMQLNENVDVMEPITRINTALDEIKHMFSE